MPRRPTRIDLPPAGHARNEELRRRADALTQEGEERFAETGSIDPAKLKIDHEIASQAELGRPRGNKRYDQFDVKDKVPGYVYVWRRENEPGSQIEWSLAEQVEMPDGEWVALWEVVKSDMPEAPNRKDVRGYRKIGDVILLRARAAVFRQYQLEQERLKFEQQHGVDAAMQDLANQSKGYVRVFNEVEMSQQKTTLERAQQMGFARSKFNQKLREGTAHQV